MLKNGFQSEGTHHVISGSVGSHWVAHLGSPGRACSWVEVASSAECGQALRRLDPQLRQLGQLAQVSLPIQQVQQDSQRY